MYYKIVSEGQIVDACNGLNFVRWQQKNGLFITSRTEEGASGIVSSDGSTIYLLEGAAEVSGYAYATYAEIAEEDYNTIRAELVENGVLDNNEDTGSSTEEEDSAGETEPVKKSATTLKIEALQEANENLQADIDFLKACILEMSEYVYV